MGSILAHPPLKFGVDPVVNFCVIQGTNQQTNQEMGRG